MKITVGLVPFLFLLFTGCVEQPHIVSEKHAQKVDILEIYSPSVAQNRCGEDPVRLVTVYVPPGYEGGDRKYPVVYYLHGWKESPMSIVRSVDDMNEYFNKYPETRFVLVAIDGRSQLGGTWWIDSSATGMWERFAVSEVPQIISEKYRVRTDRFSTGIAGFSMGGFAALNIGLKYSNQFGAVWAVAPNATLPSDMSQFINNDEESRLAAKILAFLPGLVADDLQETVDVTAILASVGWPNIEMAVIRQMSERWGTTPWKEHVEEILHTKRPVPTLYFEIGNLDRHEEYIRGLEQFAAYLEENNVPHTHAVFAGGHVGAPRIGDSLLPFFRDVFTAD